MKALYSLLFAGSKTGELSPHPYPSLCKKLEGAIRYSPLFELCRKQKEMTLHSPFCNALQEGNAENILLSTNCGRKEEVSALVSLQELERQNHLLLIVHFWLSAGSTNGDFQTLSYVVGNRAGEPYTLYSLLYVISLCISVIVFHANSTAELLKYAMYCKATQRPKS